MRCWNYCFLSVTQQRLHQGNVLYQNTIVADLAACDNIMDVQTRILTLASKKVAKEATRKELAELNGLLRKSPEMKASLKIIFDNWDSIHFDHNLSEKEIDGNLACALEKIHNRIQAPAVKPGSSPEES